MPRNVPTTSWTDRTLPTTNWVTRDIPDYTWDSAIFTWNETSLTWDSTSNTISWDNSRYDLYLEDVNGIKLEYSDGTSILLVTWNKTNTINTIWA